MAGETFYVDQCSPRRDGGFLEMASQCEAFNARFAIGAEIWVFPGDVRGRMEAVRVVEPGAYVLSGHTAVVQVTGGHGCIALSHVRELGAPFG
ncbi:MAG TPA: hypothetical protein VGL73_04300 [Caulobacteraceae bacterium]|jgi:hypothetical protein